LKSILHCIDTTGPGGAETIFVELATRLPTDCYQSFSTIRGKGWVYDELVRRGQTPTLLDARGSFNWRYLRGLCRLISQNQIDVIQSHLLGSNVYSAMAGLITKTPVIATFHGSIDISDQERLSKTKFRLINAAASRIIAVSDDLRRDIEARTLLDPQKLSVVPNGIDVSLFDRPRTTRIRQQFGWSDRDLLVGCLGNVRPAKGYEHLLQVAARTKSLSLPFRYIIAGQASGALYESLLEMRSRLGLDDHVIFLGFVDDPAEFLSNVDIFLSTSVTEGLPVAAIQAMASGLPLVATRCGGYEELISHRKNGLLADVGDHKVICELLTLLANNPEMRRLISGSAREKVSQGYSLNQMLNRYEAIYQDL
jgi:glycosyltransferase involved in cell wall biosynthesis